MGNFNNNVVNITGTPPANFTLPPSLKNFLAGITGSPSLQNLVEIGNGCSGNGNGNGNNNNFNLFGWDVTKSWNSLWGT